MNPSRISSSIRPGAGRPDAVSIAQPQRVAGRDPANRRMAVLSA